jgi:hypothetical protein
VATGTLTIAMACAVKVKMVTLPRTMNYSTGKNSMHQMGFSDTAWGSTSCSYTLSASGLSEKKFKSVVDLAQTFVKWTCACNRTTDSTEVNNLKEDERACLIAYSSESGSDCELISLLPQLD